MKWYPRYPDAFLSGIIGLTMEEKAVYSIFIDLYYSRKGDLPTDDKFFAAACECRPHVWRRIRDSLIDKKKLHYKADGKLIANRVETELNSISKRIELRFDKKNASNNKGPKNTTTPTPTKKEEGGGGGGARATPLIHEEARKVAGEAARMCGYDPEHPPLTWYGAEYQTSRWLAGGWKAETILMAIQEAMAKKIDGPPSTIKYFEKPIARFIARQTAPLPVVIPDKQEVVHGKRSEALGNGGRQSGRRREGWQERRDRKFEALAELGEFVESIGTPDGGGKGSA